MVIYYHDIVDKGQGSSYQKVEYDKFEQQMKLLKDESYTSILFEDLDKPLPPKAVLVTFDDAFKTVYETAVPVMKKYGIKGNAFVPTYYIESGHPHFMTWDMIKELADSGEFSFAAHTHTHVDIRTLSSEEMEKEIVTSNTLLQDRLGKKIDAFCMPYGKYDSNSLQKLKKIFPYKYIFACYYGHAADGKTENHLLPRIGISNDDSLDTFRQKLEGKLNWKGYLQRLRLVLANIRGERITQYDID